MAFKIEPPCNPPKLVVVFNRHFRCNSWQSTFHNFSSNSRFVAQSSKTSCHTPEANNFLKRAAPAYRYFGVNRLLFFLPLLLKVSNRWFRNVFLSLCYVVFNASVELGKFWSPLNDLVSHVSLLVVSSLNVGFHNSRSAIFILVDKKSYHFFLFRKPDDDLL